MNLSKIHKLASFLYQHKVPIIPKVLYGVQFFLFNSIVPPSTIIGARTSFAYKGIGVVIHKRAVIGSHCIIGQGVTVGGRSKHFNVPVIGDNVYLGPGCRVLGPITIGNDVVIGPNSVVINDVPSGSIVVGVPGKIIKSGIKMRDFV